MLSNKWTFSLTSLVMLLALAFAPAAMAHIVEGETVPHVHQGAIPKPELNIIDVSAAAGNQVEVYTAIGSTGGPSGSADVGLPIAATANLIDTQSEIDTLTAEDQLTDGLDFFIRLREGVASLDDRGANIRNVATGATAPTGTTPAPADNQIVGASLHILDISVAYYDKQGIGILPAVAEAGHLNDEDTKIEHQNAAFPDGRNFMVTIAADDIPANAMFMTVVLGAGTFRHSDPADVVAANVGNKVLHWNEVAKVDGNKNGNITDAAADDPPVLRLQLVNQEPDDDANPKVVSIIQVVDTVSRADQGAQTQFGAAAVSGNFRVKVTFTEEPNLTIDANNIKLDALPFNLENAKITAIVKGAPFYLAPPASEGNYFTAADAATPGDVPTPTGRDARYHPYLLTIEPALANGNDVVIRVKSFNDLVLPPNSYVPPNNLASAINRSVLRVPVHPGAVKKTDATIISDATKTNREAKRSNEIFISEGLVIPSGGYLVLVRGADQAASNVRNVGAAKYKDNDDRARADNLTDIDFKYNVKYGVAFPYPGDNLELFFNQGGTITLRYKDAPDNIKAKNKTTGYHGARKADVEGIADGSLVISEIMWGTDGAANVDSQWIELHNPGTADISIDREEWVLRFDGPTPVIGSHFDTVVDTVGNVPADAAGTEQHWTVPGSNGRIPTQVVQESTLTSMFLKIDGGTVPADGSDPSNWMASLSRPVINLLGNRVGTPGAASGYVAEMETETETETETEVVEDPVPVAGATDIVITEIMYSTGRGNLPQWIELANVSTSEASLEGWEVEIDNDGADDLSITLGATTADAGQAVLLVSKNGRNSGTGDEEGDLRRIVNLKDLGVTGTLLGSTGFQVTLTPPAAVGTSVRTAGDIAGAMDWELAAMDGDRSSLIREMNADATYKDGTMRMSWHLTTGTGRYGTYYGHPSDTGTPGYAMSGPLPVELSMFYPARDKLTGQVVITWETQSELNNAGFYIKRSEAKKGKFVVINPTMIAGAGTTAEKQSYTYTDTTAKPNVLYYYQIEDVSLDGKRATLTGAHRLRGHIGAAGKVTTIWGELKAQE